MLQKIIEIEQKVKLEPHQIRKIEEMATLIKESRVEDRYFDTADFRYTTQNMWLRQRDGAFELKIGIKKQNDVIDRYEEITDETIILKYLDITSATPLSMALSQHGLFPFCDYVIFRKSYQFGPLTIDIDEAHFGDLTYPVAEIEMVVSSLDQVPDAEQKILQFKKDLGIDILTPPPPAKLTYYLYCKRPEHYQALVSHKVINTIYQK